MTVLFVAGLLVTKASLGGLVCAILAVAWLVMFTTAALCWNGRADELVADLSTICEAA